VKEFLLRGDVLAFVIVGVIAIVCFIFGRTP
jgi:hypothetical protein